MRNGLLYETMLAKLGSRLALTVQPGKQRSRCGVLGFYYDNDVNLTVAARCGQEVRALPLGEWRAPGRVFEKLYQSIGLCSLEYDCHSAALPFDLSLRIVAPFYPGDEMLSTAPFFYLVMRVASQTATDISGSMLLALDNPFVTGRFVGGTKASSRLYREGDLIGFNFAGLGTEDQQLLVATSAEDTSYCVEDYEGKLAEHFIAYGRLPDKVLEERPVHHQSSGLCWHFDLKPGESRERVFVLAGYHNAAALSVMSQDTRFKYTEHFENAESVVRYAMESYPVATRKVALFESTLRDSSLPDYIKDLTAFAVQSYIANTWWVDRNWFTVWEGDCRFHSTLDVAYNCELFTLLYWPDLLRMQLEEWPRFRIGRYLAHDIGDDRRIFGQSYTEDMPVEECANYMLLLYAYWRVVGDNEFVKEKAGLVRELVEYIVSTDQDGDGVPDEAGAVNNTIDDGAPVTRGAPCHTYLAVKTLAAYTAAAQMIGLDLAGEIGKIEQTLREKLWAKDGYLLCAGEDSRSIYNANGLLYPLLAAMPLTLDLETFRKDIEAATDALMGPYGCTHTGLDGTVWMSQNVWRDLVGIYLGLDMLGNASRYWQFERERNVWDTGAYTDTYHHGRHQAISLERYPRGTVAAGYLCAIAGLTIDRPGRRLGIAPRYREMRVPLLIAADWTRELVPWLDWEIADKVATLRLDKCPGFSEARIGVPAEVERVHLIYAGCELDLNIGAMERVDGMSFSIDEESLQGL